MKYISILFPLYFLSQHFVVENQADWQADDDRNSAGEMEMERLIWKQQIDICRL